MRLKTALIATACAAASSMALAQSQGVTKDQIQLGSIQDLSGPLAGFGGRTPSVNPFEAKQEAAPAAPAVEDEPMDVGQEDLDRFEQMLSEVQTAYGREDYAALRKLATPEAMSYLAEELSDNATSGLRNEVRDVHLVQGDVAEAWNEEGRDYATVAMRYESIDVMRDRNTGRVVEGDPDKLTEAVELWTFVRRPGGEWQVSAIQGAT